MPRWHTTGTAWDFRWVHFQRISWDCMAADFHTKVFLFSNANFKLKLSAICIVFFHFGFGPFLFASHCSWALLTQIALLGLLAFPYCRFTFWPNAYQDEEERPRPEFAAKAPYLEKNPITGVREPAFPKAVRSDYFKISISKNLTRFKNWRYRPRLRRIAAGSGLIMLMVNYIELEV